MTFIGIITLNLLYWHFIISSKRSKFSEQNTDYLTAPLVLLCIRDVITGVINPHVNQKNGAQVWVLGVPRWPPPPAPAAFVYSVQFFFSRFSSSLHLLLQLYFLQVDFKSSDRFFFFLNRKKLELIYFYDCYFCFFLSAFSVSFISRPCVVACKLVCSRVCSCVTLNLFAYVMFPPPGNY